MRSILAPSLLALVLLTPPPALAQGERTVVTDAAALRRLRANSGVTLQWIGFETPGRGQVTVRDDGGLVHLTGGQRAARGPGRLVLDGDVLAIGPRAFTFRGRILITDAPDPGRRCVRDGTFTFRATGTRRYWRLQQMEQCDELTDYVDVYF